MRKRVEATMSGNMTGGATQMQTGGEGGALTTSPLLIVRVVRSSRCVSLSCIRELHRVVIAPRRLSKQRQIKENFHEKATVLKIKILKYEMIILVKRSNMNFYATINNSRPPVIHPSIRPSSVPTQVDVLLAVGAAPCTGQGQVITVPPRGKQTLHTH